MEGKDHFNSSRGPNNTGARRKTRRNSTLHVQSSENMTEIASHAMPGLQPSPQHRILPPAQQLPDLLPALFKTMNNMIDMVEKLQCKVSALENEVQSLTKSQVDSLKPVNQPHLKPLPLQASSRPLQCLQAQCQAQSPPPPAPGLDQARAGRDTTVPNEQIHRWFKRGQRDEDNYYLRTVEVRGFRFPQMLQQPEKTPYQHARNILSIDQTEGILSKCQVKFFGSETGRKASLRITYDSVGEARRALVRVGTSRNTLRSLSSDLQYEYFQMYPPRFRKTQEKLYKIISAERKRGNIRNFHFVVISETLCALIKIPVPVQQGRSRYQKYKTRLVTLCGDSESYDDYVKITTDDSLTPGGPGQTRQDEEIDHGEASGLSRSEVYRGSDPGMDAVSNNSDESDLAMVSEEETIDFSHYSTFEL